MGDFTMASLVIECSSTAGSPYGPVIGAALQRVLQQSQPINDWRTTFPEVEAAVANNRLLLPPTGQYGVSEVQDSDTTVWVELSSERIQNAEFQVSAVIEIARAIDPGCVVDISFTVPQDIQVDSDDPNPYYRPDLWSTAHKEPPKGDAMPCASCGTVSWFSSPCPPEEAICFKCRTSSCSDSSESTGTDESTDVLSPLRQENQDLGERLAKIRAFLDPMLRDKAGETTGAWNTAMRILDGR